MRHEITDTLRKADIDRIFKGVRRILDWKFRGLITAYADLAQARTCVILPYWMRADRMLFSSST
jgi:hypothetical protein